MIYLLSCVVMNDILEKPLTTLGIDGIAIGIIIENLFTGKVVPKRIFFKYDNRMERSNFLKDILLTSIKQMETNLKRKNAT